MKILKATFLLPNITALLQPLDQSVIEKLKKVYKKQILCLLLLVEDKERVEALKIKGNSKAAVIWTDAWETLSQDNLTKAWNKLLGKQDWNKSLEKEDWNKLLGKEDTNEDKTVDIFQAIPGFSDCGKEDAHKCG